MRILAIETSCDETAVAFVEAKGGLRRPQFKIFKNLVASQMKIHRPYGGVVPTLAKREHLKNLPILFNRLKAKNSKPKTDLIAVTVGPGLEPCLWVGINFAKAIHKSIKLLGVSHLEGHLFSNLLTNKTSIAFPAVALIISGGHTILLLMRDLTHYKKLGETRDDAVGECFDKVARLLGLPYPGGPEIEKLAKHGDPSAINFPRPMINQKNYDFSFSGLKTALFYYLRDNKNVKIKDVAASFQTAAFNTLISKTLRAAKEYKAKSILISGGVAANKTLHKKFQKAIKVKLLITQFPTDNAAMIAAAGYINYLRNKKHRLTAQGNLTLK